VRDSTASAISESTATYRQTCYDDSTQLAPYVTCRHDQKRATSHSVHSKNDNQTNESAKITLFYDLHINGNKSAYEIALGLYVGLQTFFPNYVPLVITFVYDAVQRRIKWKTPAERNPIFSGTNITQKVHSALYRLQRERIPGVDFVGVCVNRRSISYLSW